MFDEPNPMPKAQPFTSPTSPPDDNWETPLTNPIFDELVEEAGFVEPEPMPIEEPLLFSMDEEVNMAIMNKPVSLQQISHSSTITGMVTREMTSPIRYEYISSFPYLLANIHPHGVYSYFHPHLISSEGRNTLLRSK